MLKLNELPPKKICEFLKRNAAQELKTLKFDCFIPYADHFFVGRGDLKGMPYKGFMVYINPDNYIIYPTEYDRGTSEYTEGRKMIYMSLKNWLQKECESI